MSIKGATKLASDGEGFKKQKSALLGITHTGRATVYRDRIGSLIVLTRAIGSHNRE